MVCPTSYDDDAPISEAGDTRAKYMAIRDLIKQVRQAGDTGAKFTAIRDLIKQVEQAGDTGAKYMAK